MSRWYCRWICLSICGLLAAGCAKPDASAAKPAKPDAAEVEATKIAASLRLLSPADNAMAERQRRCPVDGKPLGAMGKPIKLTVQSRTLLVCSPECEKEMLDEPDKYIDKLNAR